MKWIHLKDQIERTLKSDLTCYVTTFIDYFGIEEHHEFPNWELAHREETKSGIMDILEKAMSSDIDSALQSRFIPYIQLHEFEALVFCNYQVFERYYDSSEANFHRLRQICNSNPNPEAINNDPRTAPSKRLIRYIRGYDKISDGISLTEQIGLEQILAKCLRFKNWIDTITNS